MGRLGCLRRFCWGIARRALGSCVAGRSRLARLLGRRVHASWAACWRLFQWVCDLGIGEFVWRFGLACDSTCVHAGAGQIGFGPLRTNDSISPWRSFRNVAKMSSWRRRSTFICNISPESNTFEKCCPWPYCLIMLSITWVL
jgi:hypothetical protein